MEGQGKKGMFGGKAERKRKGRGGRECYHTCNFFYFFVPCLPPFPWTDDDGGDI